MHPTHHRLLAIVLCTITGLAGTAGAQLDAPFGVTDEAGYQRLISAGTASEVVRLEYSLDPTPRVIATVAGLSVFAGENPLATDEQLDAFADAFDAALAARYPNDPGLTRSTHLVSAVRFGRLPSSGALAGTDTDVGVETIALLDLQLSADSQALRMIDFQRVTGVTLENSAALSAILTGAFMDRAADGSERAGLADAVTDYLRAEGIDPFPADLAASAPEVALAMNALPATYDAFVAEQDTGFTNALTATYDEMDHVGAQIEGHLATIGAALSETPDPVEAAQNADDAALIEALNQQRLDDLRAIAASRAVISLNSLLVAQSESPDIRVEIATAQDFSEIQLETSSTMSDISAGVQIGGSLIQGGAAIYKGDVVGAIGAFTSAISGIFGVVDEPVDTPEEQIFDQIVEMRQQIDDLRVEMNMQFDRVHGRFDSIDQQLNIIYTAMADGLNQINETTRRIDGNVQQLRATISQVRSNLNRLESNLYGVLAAGFEQDLILDMDNALGYRDRVGVDLPFAGGELSFTTFESTFFTWATGLSTSITYAGPSSLNVTDDTNGLDQLNNFPLGFNINNLREFSGALPGAAPLSNTRVANPTTWALCADAYARLARENPWFFAKIFSNQPGRTDSVQSAGDSVREAMRNARNRPLIETLIARYKARASLVATEVSTEQTAFLNSAIGSGLGLDGLDPWDDALQAVSVTQLPGVSVDTWPLSALGDDGEFQLGWGDGYPVLDLFPGVAIALYLDAPAVNESVIAFRIDYQPATPVDGGSRINYDLRLLYAGQIAATHRITLDTTNTSADIADFYAIELAYDIVQPLLFSEVGRVLNYSGDTVELIDASLTPESAYDLIVQAGHDEITWRRDLLASHLRDELAGGGTLSDAAALMDVSNALLDAYVSLGMPETLNSSDVARATLRGGGLGTDHLNDLLMGLEPTPITPPLALETMLHQRADALMAELGVSLDKPTDDHESHDYVEWTMANLHELRTFAMHLAIDDTYTTNAGAMLTVGETNGVLVNDASQPSTVSEALLFSPPTDGTVMLFADGSFEYLPDPGFVGEDSFEYEARADLSGGIGLPNTVTSEPATVVIRVSDGTACPAERNNDGTLSVLDLLDYLNDWFEDAPGAELNGDNDVTILDLLLYLDAWLTGC